MLEDDKVVRSCYTFSGPSSLDFFFCRFQPHISGCLYSQHSLWLHLNERASARCGTIRLHVGYYFTWCVCARFVMYIKSIVAAFVVVLSYFPRFACIFLNAFLQCVLLILLVKLVHVSSKASGRLLNTVKQSHHHRIYAPNERKVDWNLKSSKWV